MRTKATAGSKQWVRFEITFKMGWDAESFRRAGITPASWSLGGTKGTITTKPSVAGALAAILQSDSAVRTIRRVDYEAITHNGRVVEQNVETTQIK